MTSYGITLRVPSTRLIVSLTLHTMYMFPPWARCASSGALWMSIAGRHATLQKMVEMLRSVLRTWHLR